MEVDDSEGLQPIQADSAREDAAASKASQGSRMTKKTAATVIRCHSYVSMQNYIAALYVT